MILFRPIVVLVKSGTSFLRKPSSNYVILTSMIPIRNISSMEITKNITLLSGEKKTGKVINFKLEPQEEKPLVVMLSWLMAKRKHIYKYADFYIKKGFDVMTVTITPWQLLWPLKGSQLIAVDILKFLDSNRCYSPLVVHAFSVGGYLWAEALVQLEAERNRYQHISDRIAGQVWDSLADITEIPEGFPFAVFPKNKVLQAALKQYILYHLKTFDKVATCHYVRASQMFHTNIVRAPALFLLSKTDPIGSEKSNLRARENWESMGIQTYWKCWEKSPHVGHYHHHPEEYTAELLKFFENIGLLSENQQSQLKAKL
ncbi:transmembrane protein 53-A [Tribolium madens]|uniref:transmembrane protein 53-A n=1 Tax=Tribolium madens TaxID=41895 RepID=UPI001CF7202F|nr:transmembrane protein 53-A [Tribolium madens]